MKKRVVLLIILSFLLVCTCLLLAINYKLEYYLGAIKNIIVSTEPQHSEEYIRDDLQYGPLQLEDQFSYAVAEAAADLIIRLSSKIEPPEGLQLLRTLCFSGNPIGQVLTDPTGRLWFVFRGTATKKEWEQDFNFQQTMFNVGEDSYLCSQGFVQIFNGFRDEIEDLLKNLSCEVVVTGHSLGSALATLCVGLLANHKSVTRLKCYTFGGPRVCYDLVIPSGVDIWRINNTCDIVQQLPLAVMWNFTRCSQTFKYAHTGHLVVFTSHRDTLQDNHTMPVYIEALRDHSLLVPESIPTPNCSGKEH